MRARGSGEPVTHMTPRGGTRPEGEPPASRRAAVVRALPFEGDDAALVAALRAGRADAAAALYDRHVRIIHAMVVRLMGPDAEIDDVVHDVFVRALESLPKLREPSALRSWMFGIAVRAVAIRLQRRRRQRWLRFMAPQEVPERAVLPQTDLDEALRDVYAILEGMDAEERIALVLHRVEGMSLEDGARTMDVSLATFRRRLARGEEKLMARARKRPTLSAWVAAPPDGGGPR
jgi:RNA polymerase sigma-70 factor (ECF subfamily)